MILKSVCIEMHDIFEVSGIMDSTYLGIISPSRLSKASSGDALANWSTVSGSISSALLMTVVARTGKSRIVS